MLIELGNHAAHSSLAPLDDRPKVTSIHVPEFDDGSTHPDAIYEGRHPHDPAPNGEPVGKLLTAGPRLGGYTHKPGLDVDEFKSHLMDAVLMRGGVTQLPDHETLLAVLHPDGAWARHGSAPPAWVKVDAHPDLTPQGHAEDIERFLSDYWSCPSAGEFFGTSNAEELLVRKELQYWTRTPPGELPGGLALPPATALFTDDGRSISNINDGGGQVGAIGVGTAATATALTTTSTFVTNQWAGYRVVAYSTTSNNLVWGNVISNTNAAGASVLNVDRWYAFATPGGSAGTTPSTPWAFAILDGGMTSTWFVGLATGANAPAHGDHSLSTNGNAEITTAGGGLIRKIAPYAQTSGVASRSFTLTPVYTANGSDALPAVVTTIGVLASMVVAFSQAGGPMKFETALNASSTLSAVSDQLTVTETCTGS